jgi:hypothetical protein
MNISDLAALITVRNHINVVMNDKGVSSKDDFRPLNDFRTKLDKKFISILRETNVDDLFELAKIAGICYVDIGYVSSNITQPNTTEIGSSDISDFNKSASEIETDLSSSDGVWEDADTTIDSPDDGRGAEEAELALIAERVKAQKELLKKQGRSNKRVSKKKDDSSQK